MNEKRNRTKLLFGVLFFVSSLLLCSNALPAQSTSPPQAQQVYLTFRYKGAVNSVIIAYYKNEQFYLPVVNLFNLLGIDYALNPAELSVSGFFLNPDEQYSLHFLNSAHYAVLGEQRFELPFEIFLVKELDFYLTAAKFEQIFDLVFTVNFNALSLQLHTQKTMPVVAAQQRQRKREEIRNLSYDHSGYTLLFGRDRSMLSGGFLDYNFSANLSSTGNIYTYSTNLGAELLGGDLQGQLFGSVSDEFSTLRFNNFRYRYVIDTDNTYLTQVRAGQIASDGLSRNSILGVSITNEPVIPKVLFDDYIINGNTIPGSEVELYLNNALVGFQIADGLGNYRFRVPLTYGSSRLRVQIYGPGGEIQQRSERIDVPFTFLPPGETYYTVNAGQLSNPVIGVADSSYVLQTNVSTGLSDWLTISAGADYYEGTEGAAPTFFGSFSSRIFTNYNLSGQIAPQAFYGLSANAIYPSSVSWNLDYNYYTIDRGIYNFLGANQQLTGGIFVPLSLGSVPLNIRLFADRQFRDSRDLTRMRVNLNTRMNRVNFRIGYRDTKVGRFTLSPSPAGIFSASTTFSISRRRGIPSFLKGSFMRASASYNPHFSQIEQVEFNIARDLFENGNIQLNLARNFAGNFNVIGLNFTFDLNKVRSNTTFRRIRNRSIFTQTLRGSVGYDSHRNKLLFMNRQQVGQAGASFRLFVDENASGSYDEGEELITENAIRLSRSGGSFFQEDGIIYLTQLRAYDRYNVEVNKGVIRNPLLVPSIEEFSFIADPNRYKPIDIPFYMSGVISGQVSIQRDSLKQPVSGITVLLDKRDGEFHKELRTFTDGSFYSYEIPPGKYIARIDSSQLAFLEAAPQPEQLNFEVEAVRNGDFVDGLNFILIPDAVSQQTIESDTLQDKPGQNEQEVVIEQKTQSIDKKDSSNTDTASIKEKIYPFYVIGESFKVESNAKDFKKTLTNMEYDAKILYSSEIDFHRVAYKGFDTRSNALIFLNKIRNKGNEEAWLLIIDSGDE